MNVARRLSLSFGLGLMLVAGTAAAMPPIMDRVPSSASVVICVPSVENFEKDVKAVGALVGQPIPIGIEQLLGMVGITSGFNKTGSMVIVMNDLPGDEGENGPPDMVALIPTSDYGALIKVVGGTASGGVDKVSVNDEEAFAKSLEGGYAVIGPTKEVVEKFSGKPGASEAHAKFLGKAGGTVADGSDLFIIVNVDKLRPIIKKGFEAGMEEAEQMMGMFGGMGGMGGEDGEAPDPAAMLAMPKYIFNTLLADTQSIVFGVSIDTMGVSFDMGAQFKAGSTMAGVAASPGGATKIMGNLPAQPYLLALAADFSSPALKKFLKAVPKPAGGDGGLNFGGVDFDKAIDANDGAGFFLGIPPGGLMGGLFTRALTYQATADADGSLKMMKDALTKMDEAEMASFKYTPGAADIAGVSADLWELKMVADPDNPQAAQMMMGLFGPAGGPAGYIAKVPGGYVQTYAKSKDFAEAAVKATKGEGSLTKDSTVDQIGKKMPSGRVAEAYIGIKGLLDAGIPLLSFAGMNVDFEVPSQVPPVAAALSPSDGGLIATVYLPSQTIKTVAELAKAVEASQNQDEEDDEEMGGGQKPEGNKPGF